MNNAETVGMKPAEAEKTKRPSFVISWVILGIVFFCLVILNASTRTVIYGSPPVFSAQANGWPMIMNHSLFFGRKAKIVGRVNGIPILTFNLTGAIVNGITAFSILAACYLLSQFWMTRRMSARTATRYLKDDHKKPLGFSQFNLHTSLAIMFAMGILGGIVKWMIIDLKISPFLSIAVILFGIVAGVLVTGLAHKEIND